MVEVVHAGADELVCCGQPMKNTTGAATKKHVPIVENIANAFNVTVGNAAHPMEDKHLIEWIEVIDNSKAYQSFWIQVILRKLFSKLKQIK